MARLKKVTISRSLGNGLGTSSIEVVFNVLTDGEFYCEIPEKVIAYFEEHKAYNGDVRCRKNKAKKLAIYAFTLEALDSILRTALYEVTQPTVVEEHVIQYNIESHVSFAETPDGEIRPNAGFDNAEWHTMSSEARNMYGDHHAAKQVKGGFSLCVGAKAMTKITHTVGENVSVTYKRYYKGGSHHNYNNPAELLNSWTSFSLPKQPKEMPYTDEAALFFHNLMLGMANLSKKIQEATFNQPDLIALIESNGLLLGPPKKEIEQ